mgnify:CR=1 FL=1
MVSPETRLCERLVKATTRPFPLIAGSLLAPVPCAPELSILTRTVVPD